ncbi:hypothetical protein K449DRAFT_396089 [Hypoxylon sp. EC38]|nr:hypothetical protein K449DRAFT_396089 [Hypoxylon sp. EC38]
MGSAPVNFCARCGIQASKRCTGCLDAPEYQPGDSLDVFYCGSDCQQRHWQAHKAQCNIRRERKKLLRTAMLMKATFLAYRECTFSIPLSAIELRDSVLVLILEIDPKRSDHWLSPFPEDVTTNDKHREAAKVLDQCNAVPSLLGRLARQLLEGKANNFYTLNYNTHSSRRAGIASGIHVFTVHVEPIMSWVYRFRNEDIYPKEFQRLSHTILVAQVKDESWVIDVTGCQYGFPEIIAPRSKYLGDRVEEVLAESPLFLETETSDLDLRKHRMRNYEGVKSFESRSKHERAARLHFKTLIMERFIDGPPEFTQKFLEGTQEDFQVELDRFVADVKAHTMEFVRRAHGKMDPDD